MVSSFRRGNCALAADEIACKRATLAADSSLQVSAICDGECLAPPWARCHQTKQVMNEQLRATPCNRGWCCRAFLHGRVLDRERLLPPPPSMPSVAPFGCPSGPLSLVYVSASRRDWSRGLSVCCGSSLQRAGPARRMGRSTILSKMRSHGSGLVDDPCSERRFGHWS